VNRFLRLTLVVLGIALCLFLVRAAAAYGLSHVFIDYALANGNASVSAKAIELAPANAETHFAQAAVLSLANTPAQSTSELEQAVALRSADYRLWMELGLVRDQIGDTAGAIQALNEAIARAPYYAKPRWIRGNVLLRSRQFDAAFKELNSAAQSDQEFMPQLIDLAWGISRGDVQLTEQLAEINTDAKRLAFARLLARRGKATEAATQALAVAQVPEPIEREMLSQMIGAHGFKEAFTVWNHDRGNKTTQPTIIDGGFEAELMLGETGFGWRVPRDLQNTSFTLDTKAQSGAKNLVVEYAGNSTSGTILSELIIVEPSRRYQINFAYRSKSIVTGGLPVLVVNDAANETSQLGRSEALGKENNDWRMVSFQFTTGATTSAVVLSLQRENCATSPCPIFGSISLDSFSIQALK
jgi:tetratricopeptide (TPR) repeat protein